MAARLRAELGDDVGMAGGGNSLVGVVMICTGASLALKDLFGCPSPMPAVCVLSDGEGDGHVLLSAI